MDKGIFLKEKKCYLCLQGSNCTDAFLSKHSVHESSRTLNFLNCSKYKCRGKII